MLASSALPNFPIDVQSGPGIKVSRNGTSTVVQVSEPSLPTTGAGATFLVQTASGKTTLFDGLVLNVSPNRDFEGAPLLKVDANAVVPWFDVDGSALPRVYGGRGYRIVYDATLGGFRLTGLIVANNASLSPAPALTVKANLTGATAQPQDVTLSTLASAGNPLGDAIAAAVDQRKGGRIVAVQRGLVAGDASKAAANRILINALFAELSSLGGGVVYGAGQIYVDGPLDNKYSGVYLEGPAPLSAHDTAFAAYGLTIIPTVDCTGASDATSPNGRGAVLRHRTPWRSETGAASAPSRNVGGGFKYVRVVGNGIARRLLEVDSVSYGTYDVYLENPVGYDAAWFRSGVTGADLGEAADIQYADVALRVRCVEGAGSGAHGVTFDGSANANFSLNDKVRVVVQHVNGNGVNLANADNNDMRVTTYRVGGGTGLSVAGSAAKDVGQQVYCRANTLFLSADAPSVFQGMEASGATAPSNMRMLILDVENGTPLPTLGTGVRCPTPGVVGTYVPAVTSGAGAIGAGLTTSGRWVQNGSLVTVFASVSIPNIGTAGSFFTISLPKPMKSGAIEGAVVGTEIGITGKSVTGVAVGSSATFRFYDGSFTASNGLQFRLKIEYEN